MKYILLFLLLSCASYKKSQIYSAVAGGVIGGFVGAAAGQELSPNEESDNFNRNLGAATGLLIGSYIGKKAGESFYSSDPENFEGEELKVEPKKRNELVPLKPLQIELSDLGIKIDNKNSKAYKIEPTSDLPKQYMGDVQKQILIKHKIPERKIHLPDGRTYILKETELIEHKYTR